MKLFEVVFERDGKKKGELVAEKRFYVAESAEQVWDHIAIDRADLGMRFDSLREALPMVIMLEPSSADIDI